MPSIPATDFSRESFLRGRSGKSGLTFIGPDPKVIKAMGSKIEARKIASGGEGACGAGIEHPLKGRGRGRKSGQTIRPSGAFFKACGGRRRKGMRAVHADKDLKAPSSFAQGEALKSFKDGSIYIEKLIEGPHHIEVQVFGDQHGNAIHLGSGNARCSDGIKR